MDVVSILEESSLALEWINPELCGIWHTDDEIV